jgi:hypothetical protein
MAVSGFWERIERNHSSAPKFADSVWALRAERFILLIAIG